MTAPAARLGDITAHAGSAVPGPGAIPPKGVFTNGKTALRASLDTIACPIPIAPPAPAPHGPEKCVLGSMTVLINKKMAVRVGDLWIGAGPANYVTVGSSNVNIGDTGFGLADAGNMAEFCKGFAKLAKDWPSLTPDERRQQMADLLNQQLGKSGCPPIGVNSQSALSGTTTLGEFDFYSWNIDVNPDLLAGNILPLKDAKQLANTLYHEARHTEQWWNIARTQAGGGVSATQLSSDMGLPLSTSQGAAASPISGTSPEAIMGETMHQSVYGTDGAYRNTALTTGTYDQYRALPEEQDAWRTGDTLPCGH